MLDAVRVLVVEDEAPLADAVARGLRREGMAVDVAYDGADGDEKATVTRYDVVVLDRDLPGMSGDELCRRLAAEGALTRVLMLTAGGLALDPARRMVSRSGRPVELTRKEFGVLEVLLAARGAVVSSEELLDRVWDENADPFTTTVRVTVMTLRRKLGDPAVVETVVGAGYRISIEPPSAAAAYGLAGRALQPVSRVTATARRLSEETLDERIALEGPPDELKELADTFDAMAARLDAAFDSQRRFVANASHELRTPLAVIRTEVDVTLGDPEATVADLRTMGEVVRDASVRADQLVDALLVLARSEGQARSGLEQREPVDLAGLVPRAIGAGSGG